MDDLWFEFRMAPSAYLVKHRTNVEALVHELLQVCMEDGVTISKRHCLHFCRYCTLMIRVII